MPKKKSTKKLPSEINWLHGNTSNTLHTDFFSFFKTYDKRRAHIRFLEVIKHMEDEAKKKKALEEYEKWRKSREAKEFWTQRNQVNQEGTGSTFVQQLDSSSNTTTEESIDTISLAAAKAIIIEKITPIDENSTNNSSFSNSISKFKNDVYNSLDVSLLTYETHLQHLLVLSNILLIGKNSNWHPQLQNYFVDPIMTIRKNMYNSFGFNETNHKFPSDIMMTLITIINNINCGLLTRLSAEDEISVLIKDCTDIVIIRLLLCIKSMVETLPLISHKKEIKESELCSRFLQTAFQKLFDCDQDELIFKWINANCFDNTNNNSNQKRPDGTVENDMKAVGYFEVKPISYAKNHRKINIDLHRLCVLSKTGSAVYKAKHMFQIMAVGTNIQFHISQVRDDVLVVVELDHIRLPLSLDELPQMIPYLGRLYNVVKTIHQCCYENNIADVPCEFGYSLEPEVIKAITEKTTDRARSNCFYNPYH